jgi:hypothetical protein
MSRLGDKMVGGNKEDTIYESCDVAWSTYEDSVMCRGLCRRVL